MHTVGSRHLYKYIRIHVQERKRCEIGGYFRIFHSMHILDRVCLCVCASASSTRLEPNETNQRTTATSQPTKRQALRIAPITEKTYSLRHIEFSFCFVVVVHRDVCFNNLVLQVYSQSAVVTKRNVKYCFSFENLSLASKPDSCCFGLIC